MRPKGLFFCILAISSAVGRADIVHLKDGTSLDGSLKHADNGWIVTVNGKALHVGADEIESIELTPSIASGSAVAADRLASLRRSVENLSDLPEIIARFQRFIDTGMDPATTTDAKKDLAIWQDRLRQKRVKVGTKWVLPVDRQKLLDQSNASAEQARQLMKQGRTKEAEPLLNDAVSINPQNAAALYLLGLLQYQREQISQARKSFDAVAALVPNHAPTLNNLAIVQWRQHQFIPALMSYDAAMLASPVNNLVLDNLASALLSLPDNLQKSPVTAKTLRHFQEQDQQLSQQMAQSGLHRYGAIWVSDRDRDLMRQQEKQTQDKLDALAGDFDRDKAHIDQLDKNISETAAQIRQIETTSSVMDPVTAQLVPIPYPTQYYQLTRDLHQMQQQRSADVAHLDELKKQAQDLQQNRPSAKFTGVQRLAGPEGTPLAMTPAIPATQPAR